MTISLESQRTNPPLPDPEISLALTPKIPFPAKLDTCAECVSACPTVEPTISQRLPAMVARTDEPNKEKRGIGAALILDSPCSVLRYPLVHHRYDVGSSSSSSGALCCNCQ